MITFYLSVVLFYWSIENTQIYKYIVINDMMFSFCPYLESSYCITIIAQIKYTNLKNNIIY